MFPATCEAMITRWRDRRTLHRSVYGVLLRKEAGEYLYLTMSGEPLAPVNSILSRGPPPYESMGCEISFRDFPEGCQRLVLDIYRELWDL